MPNWFGWPAIPLCFTHFPYGNKTSISLLENDAHDGEVPLDQELCRPQWFMMRVSRCVGVTVPVLFWMWLLPFLIGHFIPDLWKPELEMWMISFSSILFHCECNLNKVPYAAQYHWHLNSSGMWELWRWAAVKGEAGPAIFRNPENPRNLLSFPLYQIPFISFWQLFPSGLPAASCHMIGLVLLCTVVGKHKK